MLGRKPARAPSESLKLTPRQRDGESWLDIEGEIDLLTIDTLKAELGRQHARPVILDLSKVTFMDSTGIALLVRHAEWLVIGRASTYVRELLDTCGLAPLLPHYAKLDLLH
jgi:anti-anti-sigma factor